MLNRRQTRHVVDHGRETEDIATLDRQQMLFNVAYMLDCRLRS